MFHAGDGSNRWFDKAFCLIVTNDGRAGVNGEHAPLDALVASIIMRKAVALYFLLLDASKPIFS